MRVIRQKVLRKEGGIVMIEFNFNSQICTTREQSERLLALGLKKETADMTIHIKNDDGLYVTAEPFYEWDDDMNTIPSLEDIEQILPAWSLYRLIEMMPYCIEMNDKYRCLQISKWYVRYAHNGTEKPYIGYIKKLNTFDAIIECIEWLIKEDRFNKKYLV